MIDVWLEAESEEAARKELDLLSDRLYANPVIEDWEYDLEEIEEFPKGIKWNTMTSETSKLMMKN